MSLETLINSSSPAHRAGSSASRRGFTLVELLVVIGIIALLISILLPALNKARQHAQTVACLSNQRQIAMSMIQYANDNKGVLPPYGEIHAGNPYLQPDEYWYNKLSRYVSRTGQFFYGVNFMRCPSQHDDTRFATYGVNYGYTYYHAPFAILHLAPPDMYAARDWAGSQKLSRVRPATFLTADCLHLLGSGDLAIYNPGIWELNIDTDGDGLNDTNSDNYSDGSGTRYNHFDPRHAGKVGVASFADGSARTVPLSEWINPNNKGKVDGIWGPVGPGVSP